MIISSYLIFVALVQYGSGCGLPLEESSWGENQVSSNSRHRRQANSPDRMDCGTNDEPPPSRTDTTERVNELIQLMRNDNIDATIIPTSDAHQTEYVSPSDKRRDYISGFTGSAGTVVVLADGRRALWTDGRYHLQGDLELDCNWILMRQGNEGTPTILEWLKTSLSENSRVGNDPNLISAEQWLKYEKELAEVRIQMVATRSNYIDEITRGTLGHSYVQKPLSILELQFAGKSWEDKVADVRVEMGRLGAEMMVITALDEVAWLLNLRGGDIPHSAVFKSYAIIDQQNVKLFMNKSITLQLDHYLRINQCEQECVEVHNYETIRTMVSGLASSSSVNKVMLPIKVAYTGGVNYAIYSAVPEEKVLLVESPILKMKARKNAVEYEGMKNAHRKDATALIDFLSFMEEEIAAQNRWTEISAADRLAQFRAEQENFQDLSFQAISAFGPNGAIIHYRPQNSTDTVITDKSLYLLDSGGQYKDGITDVTRTMHYGTPTEFQKEAYTRVLQGALDLAMITFPKDIKDTRIDILARRSLYGAGLDYKHGTGHGIGIFIHESPTQIRVYGKEEHKMENGYFFSDEPGYYKDGEFGIRLETILAVAPKETKHEPFEQMFGFEAITLVPFEPKLIEISILNSDQCNFLNDYHNKVEKIMGPLLIGQGRHRAYDWMVARTTPLPCSLTSTSNILFNKFASMLSLFCCAVAYYILR